MTGRDEKTLVKLVVEGNSERVLGAHIVGEHALLGDSRHDNRHQYGCTKKDFGATLGIHPTVAEFVTLR